MRPKPACFGAQYASAFQEMSVAAAYQYRPPYPPSVFEALDRLIIDTPRYVLDVGCGTGALARHLTASADRIDAVDISPAMIAHGQRLPNGDHPRINWIVGPIEQVQLTRPYALITAGESLHWMEWDIVLPRFHALLSRRGVLAIVELEQLAVPWSDALHAVIQQYSTNRDYQPTDLVTELVQRGLFAVQGRQQTHPFPFRQSLDAYIESFHGRASFSRERMVPSDAEAFDRTIRALVVPFATDIVELQLVATITWGQPMPSTTGA
jgi:predicted TPR repeat methyltransferase